MFSLGALLATAVRWSEQTQLESARAAYRAESHGEAVRRAKAIEEVFRTVYQHARTIGRLPGVRSIDRYAREFDPNARGAVQEIYNNLATDVAVSELYIVPVDLDPEAIDPVTGLPQAPITTFDELIVGRTADEPRVDGREERGRKVVEEIEIHEYRLMAEQLGHFRRRCPTEASLKGLEYPALSGREVVTCDNSRYSASRPDDRSRSGIVYSIPFFSIEGELRGCVSAVILTGALRELLPDNYSAIVAPGNGYFVARDDHYWPQYTADLARLGVPDPSLLYSESITIPVNDGGAPWMLWNGRPDGDFWVRPDARAARSLATGGYCGSVAVTGLVLIAVGRSARRQRHVAEINRRLEGAVQERTAALAEKATQLDQSRVAAEQASRAKSEFLANMSHEIRTPMTAILGYADLILDRTQSVEQRAESVQTIRRNGEHLMSIINDILDLSKIEAGRMGVERAMVSPVSVVEEVRSLMQVRAASKGLELRVEYEWPLPACVNTDALRLRQILVNLVGNGLKFTERGGVTVRVRYDGDEGAMRFEVVDSGIGMTGEEIGRLFQPFVQADCSTTRRFGGTGLGLTISKRLAAMLDGDISVDSTPNRGSVFTLLLRTGPHKIEDLIAGPPVGAQGAGARGGVTEGALAGVRVLVAEDGPDNQRLIAYHLRRAGAEVRTVDNGMLASEAAMSEGCGPGRETFDVVLMDMQMPELDGYGATALLRQRGYQGPILALTAHAMSGDREKCLAVGCDDYLTKPIDSAALVERCLVWSRQSRRARAA